MFRRLKHALSKLEGFNASLGDVVYETKPIIGAHKGRFQSFMRWRVKRALDGRLFLGAKMLPDAYAGPDGAIENFIYFDLSSAEQLRADLDSCIAELKRQAQSAAES